jgi:hypothetical protein
MISFVHLSKWRTIGKNWDYEKPQKNLRTENNRIAEYDLAALPILDGMITANERLYLSMKNSSVVCFSGM